MEFAAEADKIIYSFEGSPNDGCGPVAPLVTVNGDLYGTTVVGGASKNSGGTVFRVTSSGQEVVLHSFGSGTDGYNPEYGPLLKVGSLLYGTTSNGGKYGNGTVFSISLTGSEKIVYSFKGEGDGIQPEGGLIYFNGYLYGTTPFGGSTGNGTVFRLDRSGKEAVLYSFKGLPDGSIPSATLIEVGGALYGTTFAGGVFGSPEGGYGTAFSITTQGVEQVIHSFGDGADGISPASSLIDVNGTLYGTTQSGGTAGNGTVFAINGADQETVLHSFKAKGDGASPSSSLTLANGLLFGSTVYGGSGNGTIFDVNASGVEHVVHDFGYVPDGWNPYDAVTSYAGMLYGTTEIGGADFCGVVFSLKP